MTDKVEMLLIPSIVLIELEHPVFQDAFIWIVFYFIYFSNCLLVSMLMCRFI